MAERTTRHECGPCKPGWYCSREAGHDGPHAAWPTSHETMPEAWLASERDAGLMLVSLLLVALAAFALGVAAGLWWVLG